MRYFAVTVMLSVIGEKHTISMTGEKYCLL